MKMTFFLRILTWWHGHTVGTGLFTWRKGDYVGSDDDGNRYYREKDGPKRWVLYNGEVEASRVPPEWHAWLHYIVAQPPTEAPPETQDWEQKHVANLTGSAGAYFPDGSLNEGGRRRRTSGDYEAWRP